MVILFDPWLRGRLYRVSTAQQQQQQRRQQLERNIVVSFKYDI